MYMKQVTIGRFGSYNDVLIKDLSPKINCFVGVNGSGSEKSDLINAICFLIGDSSHEREGEYVVEIVFGGPNQNDVCLRRILDKEKDEYFLAEDITTKNGVIDFLRGCGFFAGLYGFVKQGTVHSLSLLEDFSRLHILRIISGVQGFMKDCCHNAHVLKEAENRRKQLKQVMEFSNKTLSQLDDLNKELNKYQTMEKILENCIGVKEVDEVNTKLNTMLEEVFSKFQLLATKLKELKILGESVEAVKRRVESQDMTRRVAAEKCVKLNHDIKDYEKQLKEKSEAEARLSEINGRIKVLGTSVDSETDRIISTTKLIPLYEKQDPTAGCQNVQTSIKEQLTREIKELRRESKSLQESIDSNAKQISIQEANISDSQSSAISKNSENLHQQQRELWDKEQKLADDIRCYRTDLGKQTTLDRVTPGSFGGKMSCENLEVAKTVDHHPGFFGVTYEELRGLITKKQAELNSVESALEDIDCRINERLLVQLKDENHLDKLISELEHLQQVDAYANERLQYIKQALLRKESLKNILETVHGESDVITPSRETEFQNVWSQREKLEATTADLECQLRNLILWQKLEAGKQCKTEVEALEAKLNGKKTELILAEELIKQDVDDLSATRETPDEVQEKYNTKDREVKDLWVWCERVLREECTGETFIKSNDLLEELKLLPKKDAELPSLSSDERQMQQTYMEKKQDILILERNVCSKKIVMLRNVYKAALEVYESIKRENEDLQQKETACTDAAKEVQNYMSVLGKSLEKSVETTFMHLKGKFKEVFAALVKDGDGYLSLTERKDNNPVDTVPCDDKFIGLEVKVSFPGRHKDLSMRQLTGGEKKIVSLALIFAIQELDPPPFWFLDEIDATILEPQYREAIAIYVQKFAANTKSQIIMTACSSEMMQAANKIYHVERKNESSCIEAIERQAAEALFRGKGLLS